MSNGVCNDKNIIDGILSTPLDDVFDSMIKSTKKDGVKHKEWCFNWDNVKITIHVALTEED